MKAISYVNKGEIIKLKKHISNNLRAKQGLLVLKNILLNKREIGEING